ncbi:uncharacterized protein LOC143541871 [Bidens hawaiensis]|uniref:uncharacterized protein LOC143541871 n=1 Tax=Bidens hawaiensis TaxID=980011 RepID=UPI004048F11C
MLAGPSLLEIHTWPFLEEVEKIPIFVCKYPTQHDANVDEVNVDANVDEDNVEEDVGANDETDDAGTNIEEDDLLRKWLPKGRLDSEGYRDWQHATTSLIEHEVSLEHLKNMASWFKMPQRFKVDETIDKEAYKHFKKERDYWKQVLFRIIAFVKFLGKKTLAFRGTNEKLYQEDNGFFVGLVEMVEVEESLLGFLIIDDTTDKRIFDITYEELKSLGFDIDDLRSREVGLSEAIEMAKGIAIEMGVDPVFPQRLAILRKKNNLTRLQENKKFYFQMKIKGFRRQRSHIYCILLQDALKYGEACNSDAKELYMELKMMETYLPDEIITPIDALKFLKKVDHYPNASVAYRVLFFR